MKVHRIVKIAKDAILEELTETSLIDKVDLMTENPTLAEEVAVFVTLEIDGRLRGCIGSLQAHRSLLEDIIRNAKAAAFSDPRFPPLTLEEYNAGGFSVEVSILSAPKPLEYTDIEDLKSKIEPNVDGVILTLSGHRATFLPQVWEQLPTFELFFAHLCQKAGLEAGCLARHPEILTYQAEKIKEG